MFSFFRTRFYNNQTGVNIPGRSIFIYSQERSISLIIEDSEFEGDSDLLFAGAGAIANSFFSPGVVSLIVNQSSFKEMKSKTVGGNSMEWGNGNKKKCF